MISIYTLTVQQRVGTKNVINISFVLEITTPPLYIKIIITMFPWSGPTNGSISYMYEGMHFPWMIKRKKNLQVEASTYTSWNRPWTWGFEPPVESLLANRRRKTASMDLAENVDSGVEQSGTNRASLRPKENLPEVNILILKPNLITLR